MIEAEDRINFYYGDFPYGNTPPELPEVVKHDVAFLSSQDYSLFTGGYKEDIDEYLALRSNPNNHLWFHCGDSSYKLQPYPVIVKARDSHNPNANGVICAINRKRHWEFVPLAAVHPDLQVDWHQKISMPVWRGVSTSLKHDYHRGHLVTQYSKKYDFGFSNIVEKQAYLDVFEKYNLEAYVKPPLSIKQLLHYKYIVAIDGNDKASSINWILASTSVPIMPKPRFHSYLCEPWLEPNVHYVEVKRDFSDLEEKIEWCQNNDKLCQEIAANGKAFILDNFSDREREFKIQKDLIQKVESHVR